MKFALAGMETKLVWSESIGAQGVIFERKTKGKNHRLSGDQNARGSVGYGGGDFDVNKTEWFFQIVQAAIFTSAFDQKTDPKAISPAWGSLAAPAFSPDGKWVIYCYHAGETDGLALTRVHGLDLAFTTCTRRGFLYAACLASIR